MPIISRIEGRTHDYIESPRRGKFTSIYMSLVSEAFDNCMKGMQFIQNDLQSVDVYIVTDENYKPEMNGIIEYKLKYDLGEEFDIRIHRVDHLKKDASGKTRLIINNVALQRS